MKLSLLKKINKAHGKNIAVLNAVIIDALKDKNITVKESAEILIISEYLSLISDHVEKIYYITLEQKQLKKKKQDEKTK